ncbi:hypothetical protein CJU89_5667 [Yarrowia sp. B02]|nr:hypothetical protein CJU89_5667 [Yarrowia sp. B02]
MMTFTPYVIPSPPQTPVYVKDDMDVLSTDMDPLNLWEKDSSPVLWEDSVSSPLDSIAHGAASAPCGSPCSVCTECCCDACANDTNTAADGVCSWEDVDVEPLNLAIANTCGKAQVAFALPSGCDASSYGSETESLMDSVMLDSSHETYTPSNFLGMSRDAEKMGSDQVVQSAHSFEATFVSPARSAHENLAKISMGLAKLSM